ncbi:MAG: hypothetical protein JKY53_06220 [Flavobacteriales bacterium]|nr:hypothetical protein [Flavobacteriales bacterium]
MTQLQSKISFTVTVLIIGAILTSTAQKQGNIWYFGKFAGLDFNSGSPTAIYDSAMETREGCSAISDSLGNLLFYTNGVKVWDRNHQVMPNGGGLYGSSTTTQSALIVKKPLSDSIYYVFTVAPEANPSGLNYSVVDMSLNNGFGDVVTKNEKLWGPIAEKLVATIHSNGFDIWIGVHDFGNSDFLFFLLSDQGISPTPVITSIGSAHDGGGLISKTLGQMKTSKSGSKLGLVLRSDDIFMEPHRVELFNFSQLSGVVSNLITINSMSSLPYGFEFSPNEEYVYVTDGSEVSQYDITSNNSTTIESTKTIIATTTNINEGFWGLQLGPDDKIYNSIFENDTLARIDFPNLAGLSCGYDKNAVFLGGFPHRCKLSLPGFMISDWNVQPFYFQFTCLGDSTEFWIADSVNVDSVYWNFGDPSTGLLNETQGLIGSHAFSDTGLYSVTVQVFTSSGTITYVKEVGITTLPEAFNLGSDTTICLNDSLVFDLEIPIVFYLWNDSSNTPKYCSYGDTLIWVEIANGCGDFRDSIHVSYIPLPSVNLGSDTSVCYGDSLVLNAFFPNATYLWDMLSTDSIIYIDFDDAWSQEYFSVSISTQCGTAFDEILIDTYLYFPISLGEDDSLCVGEQKVLETYTSDADYLWNTGSIEESISVGQSGQYWVSISSVCGVHTDTINVIFIEPPLIELIDDTLMCRGDTLTLTLSFPNVSYLWHDGSSDSTYSTHNTEQVMVTLTTKYCVETDSIFVLVLPELYLVEDTAICDGDIISLGDGQGKLIL